MCKEAYYKRLRRAESLNFELAFQGLGYRSEKSPETPKICIMNPTINRNISSKLINPKP